MVLSVEMFFLLSSLSPFVAEEYGTFLKIIGSLSNGEDDPWSKMNLYFISEI